MNKPSTYWNGPVEVPQNEQCDPLRASVLEHLFERMRSQLPWGMTVRRMLTRLQHLPQDTEVLAFEPGCEEYCEREVDEVEWQGGRV